MMPLKNLKILVADDHALARTGIRALLERMKSVSEVHEASNGREAVAHCIARKPHVALLEASLSGLNGVDAAERIARQGIQTRVILFSRSSGEELVARALTAGAAGFLVKETTASELETAMQAVVQGSGYLSPSVSRQVVQRYMSAAKKSGGKPDLLTSRQREILQLVAEGMSSKEIASSLGVSIKTVETHRAHIMQRLGIRDLAGLVRYAVRTGIVTA